MRLPKETKAEEELMELNWGSEGEFKGGKKRKWVSGFGWQCGGASWGFKLISYSLWVPHL